MDVKWLGDSSEDRKQYNDVIAKITFSNIPQEWDYGAVKAASDGDSVKRCIILSERAVIGTMQVLIKTVHGIPVFTRINRGPMFIDEYNYTDNHCRAISIARKGLMGCLPCIYAPNIEWDPKNLEILTRYGWKMWRPYGYETGRIDLRRSLEEIRGGFGRYFRNRLKSAENKDMRIRTDFDRFDEMIGIYERSQKEKDYEGIPSNVLYGLMNAEESPLEIFYITDVDCRIIAFDIFYFTENFGLYLVGWNNEKGREMCTNNLLFYNAICHYKERGARWLDVGGISYISTEEIARFKDGMCPEHVRFMGEFFGV